MRHLAGALSALVCLAGCSQDSAPAPTVTHITPKTKQAAASAKGPTAEELTAGMVQAASASKAAMPIDVKFELADRPKVGKPLEVNLALVAQTSGGPAAVALSGGEGFQVPDNAKFEVGEVQEGEVYRHTFMVTPNSEGVLILNLNVSLKHDEVADAKDFSIPVIVSP